MGFASIDFTLRCLLIEKRNNPPRWFSEEKDSKKISLSTNDSPIIQDLSNKISSIDSNNITDLGQKCSKKESLTILPEHCSCLDYSSSNNEREKSNTMDYHGVIENETLSGIKPSSTTVVSGTENINNDNTNVAILVLPTTKNEHQQQEIMPVSVWQLLCHPRILAILVVAYAHGVAATVLEVRNNSNNNKNNIIN